MKEPLRATSWNEAAHPTIYFPIRALDSMYEWGACAGDYEVIKRSIENEGMYHPIICWYTSVAEWDKVARAQPGELIPPDKELLDNYPDLMVHLVMCGNNRVQVAKDLGYESIEGVVSKSREEISRLCGGMRKSWREIVVESARKL